MHFEKKDDILMELTKTAENKTENDAWLSLVERYVRDVEVAGSNPVTPTNEKESLKKGSFFMIEMRERSTDVPVPRSFYTRFFFFFFASGRNTVTLPMKHTICTRMTPTVTPTLSIATSRFDGPRPATKDWWYSSSAAKPTQKPPARSKSQIPRTPYTYSGKDTETASRKYSVIWASFRTG